MNSLIKHADAVGEHAIERFNWARTETSHTDRDPQIVALEASIAELKRALTAQEAKHRDALAEARLLGRKEAELDHTKREKEAVSALSKTIEETAADARQHFDNIDALALMLCDIVLEKLFDTPNHYPELIAQTLRKHVRALRSAAVLAATVSPIDFADATALDDLAHKLAPAQIEIRRDPTLASGECRIHLRLGTIDISIPTYWRELKAELNRLAGGAASA